MSNGLTTSESQNIQSPPGNSLAIFLDKNGTLQAKDVRGNVYPMSNYLPTPEQGETRITRAEAVVLQETASFVPGTVYVITDADVNLYGGTEITLTAITNTELSLQGSGKFFCPKYDLSAEGTGYGIWTTYMEGEITDIVGNFAPNEPIEANNGATGIYIGNGLLSWVSGDFSTATSIQGQILSAEANISGFISPEYTMESIAHWGGKSWTNRSGNVGSSIDKYTLDAEWEEIPFNENDYNVYVDEIQYDFGNDMIIYRKDRYNNVVSGSNQVFVEFQSPDGFGYGNPIKDFQWGCAQDDFNTTDYLYAGIYNNQVIDSYFETLNTIAKGIYLNIFTNQSYFYDNILSPMVDIYTIILNNSSGIYKNIINGSSSIYSINLSASNINDNTLNSSTISNNFLFTSNIGNNILSNFANINDNYLNGSSISNNIFSSFQIANNNLFFSIFSFSNISTDIIYCQSSKFGSFFSDIDLTGSTILGTDYNKQLFNNSNNTPRLQYVNGSDVIVIADVNA